MGEDENKKSSRGKGGRDTYRGFGPPKRSGTPHPEPETAEFGDGDEENDVSGSEHQAGAPSVKRRGLQQKKAAGRPEAEPLAILARRARQPAVDIDLIHERRTAPLPDQQWTFVEIWTRNTIYALDSRLECIAVVDQSTRTPQTEHALIGARLVGGQRRDGETMELSHPFPRPGSEAVFEKVRGKQVRFSQTSGVTRVVLRLRVLTVSSDHILPTWEEITGRYDVPGAKNKG